MKFLVSISVLFFYLYSFEIKKGDFATIDAHNINDIKWGDKFKIVEVGDLDDSTLQLKQLHNTKLGYDWLVAFYFYKNEKNTNYVKDLYFHRDIFTLNPDGEFLHCKKSGYYWCDEYYYNFANDRVVDKKINYLISNMKKNGFDGLFFDWADATFILQDDYKNIYKRFKKISNNKNYFQEIAKFYKKLKDKNIFFITNQAFREAKYFLPYIKYDMTESYITSLEYLDKRIMVDEKGFLDKVPITNYYPIDNKSIKATLFYIDKLQQYKQKYAKYGFKNFIYLNYLAPVYEKIYQYSSLYKEKTPKNGIYFSYAMAKITDSMVYAEVTDNKNLEKDDIYFYDLGDVKDNNYTKLKNLDIYIRFYENGFVLVSDSYHKDKNITLDIDRKFYDTYNAKSIKDKTINLHYEKDTFSNKKVPLGRVFLYEDKK